MANCKTCKCPLTLLKVGARTEARSQCARCAESGAMTPPVRLPVPKVTFRRVDNEKPKDALVLKIDQYLKRGLPKKRAYDA